MLSKKKYLLLFRTILIMIIFGLVIPLPILYFHPDLGVLSNYATFNNYFLSFANLIVVGIISYLVYDTTHRYNQFQMTPVLDLMVDPKTDSWELINCSNISARNISVRFKIDANYSKWVACYSLIGQGRISLPWIKLAGEIQIAFSDTSLEKYSLLTYGSLMVREIKELDKIQVDEIISTRDNSAIVTAKYQRFFAVTNPGPYQDFFDYHLN